MALQQATDDAIAFMDELFKKLTCIETACIETACIETACANATGVKNEDGTGVKNEDGTGVKVENKGGSDEDDGYKTPTDERHKIKINLYEILRAPKKKTLYVDNTSSSSWSSTTESITDIDDSE